MALLVCGVLAASGGSGAERASSTSDAAKRFVATLFKNGSARIEHDPMSCLAASSTPVIVAAELAAIFGRYIDSGWSFAITASCEAGESAARQFCRVSFYHRLATKRRRLASCFAAIPPMAASIPRPSNVFRFPE